MSVQATLTPNIGLDPHRRRLESWKEIAAYLGRDVTTVRRWERREGLPVHRILHRALGSVYAYTAELDAWLEWPERKFPRAVASFDIKCDCVIRAISLGPS